MRRPRTDLLYALAFLVVIAGCFSINVNVYFDQKKAEQAVDKVLDNTNYPKARERAPEDKHSRAPASLLEAFCPPVEAADDKFNLDVESPAIKKITERMKERWDKWLEAAFNRNNLGVSKEAQFVIRNMEGVSEEKARAELKKAVAEESSDHDELFREIAKANNLPKEHVTKIRAAFANRYRARAQKGWWIQDDEGKWSQKAD